MRHLHLPPTAFKKTKEIISQITDCYIYLTSNEQEDFK